MNSGDRPRAMAERVAQAARRESMASADVEHIVRVLDAVFAQRARFIAEDVHGDELHPGRSAIILLDDVGAPPPATVVAAIALDSVHPEWMQERTAGRALIGDEAAALLDELPQPGTELDIALETLLVASEPARLAAVAEWLDHARHLHLREPSVWRAFHERTERVHLPIAMRTNGVLEYRLATWCRMFRERYLRD